MSGAQPSIQTSQQPRLIVVRGPAGAGKSTITRQATAQLRATHNEIPVALEEQDYFNNTIAGRQSGYRDLAIKMILRSGLACREEGYSLIVEGVLNIVYYKDCLDQLIAAYGIANTTFYYMDVSLEETKARHQTRPKAKEFSADLLDEWYAAASPSGYANEVTLGQHLSAQESIDIIVGSFSNPPKQN